MVIPPGVGYISNAVGGQRGDLRAGMLLVLAASVLMLLLHIALALRERRRASMDEAALEMDAAAREA
jgi:cbb3-type cytochrome oxidase subunit 3